MTALQDTPATPTVEGVGDTNPPSGGSVPTQGFLYRCKHCSVRWSSPSQAHCSTCHHHFSSSWAFDRHRLDGKCLDPHTLMGETDPPRLVFRTTERKNCSIPLWIINDGKDETDE